MPRERVTIPTEPTPGICAGPNCGREVLWVMTVGNDRMPLDPELSPDGNVVPVTMPDGSKRVRVLTGAQLPALHPCFVPHHRTCPDSDDYHRRRAATAPRCRAGCGYPMDPWLTANGWPWHLNCAPPPDVRQHVDAARSRRDEVDQLPGMDGAA